MIKEKMKRKTIIFYLQLLLKDMNRDIDYKIHIVPGYVDRIERYYVTALEYAIKELKDKGEQDG